LACARCENEQGKVVLFPFKVTGQFYVSEVDAGSTRHAAVDQSARVYRWPDLLLEAGHGTKDRHGKIGWSVQEYVQFSFLRVKKITFKTWIRAVSRARYAGQ
jgi:hypothetical protein